VLCFLLGQQLDQDAALVGMHFGFQKAMFSVSMKFASALSGISGSPRFWAGAQHSQSPMDALGGAVMVSP
jgi:hypothetical protein